MSCGRGTRFVFSVLIISSLFPILRGEAASKDPAADPFQCPDCNVIFISVTNLRAKHLPFYGYARDTAPALNELAKKSVVFDQAYTVASWTLPAATSIFTSLYPFQHQVMERQLDKRTQALNVMQDCLADNKVTLFDVLGQEGYTTVSINSGVDYLPEHGVTSRVDFGISVADRNITRWGKYGTAAGVIPRSIAWLEKNKTKKFFMQLQVYDTHCPFAYPSENKMFDPNYGGDVDFTRCYWTFGPTETIKIKKGGQTKTYYRLTSPDVSAAMEIRYGKSCAGNSCAAKENPYEFMLDERDIQHMVALYDGEIYNVDMQLKKLFSVLKKNDLMKNTIIVFFSEHGDMMGEHGRFMRGGQIRGTFYNDVLHVPLMIYHPKIKARRVAEPVSVIDISPSVLDFLHIATPAQFQGKSVSPLLHGKAVGRKIYGGSLYIPSYKNLKNSLNLKGVSNYFFGSTVTTVVLDHGMKLIRETVIVPPGYQGAKEARVDTQLELYDLLKDPQEEKNLKDTLPEKVKQLSQDLDGWFYSLMAKPYNAWIEETRINLFIKKPQSEE